MSDLPTPAERALAFALRANGAITALALLAVFMPLDSMANTHRRLGMGLLPAAPIVEYLARTVSFLYFVHGGLCLLLATDVRRFGPVITYVASVELLFAALLLWIDESAHMPRAWTLIEVPAVAAMGALILTLRLRAKRELPD